MHDFARACKRAVDIHGSTKFELLAQSLVDTDSGLKHEREVFWHTLAIRVDWWSRHVFLALYSLLILVLYRIDVQPPASKYHVNV